MPRYLNLKLFLRTLFSIIVAYAYFIVPTLTEVILIVLFKDHAINSLIIIINSILIHIMVFKGGFSFIFDYYYYEDQLKSTPDLKVDGRVLTQRERNSYTADQIWCQPLHSEGFFGPGHITLATPLWILCNMICTYHWAANWVVYAFSYSFLVSYGLGIATAYSYNNSMMEDKHECKCSNHVE